MLRALAILMTLLWLIAGSMAMAAPARIDIVIPPNNSVVAEFAQTMRRKLLQSPVIGAVSVLTAEQVKTAPQRGVVAISVGETLLPWTFAADNPYPVRLAFYVSADAFRLAGKTTPTISAIYYEQPLERQLQLARLLLPNLQRVAVVQRADAPFDVDALSRSSGLTIQRAAVDPDANWAKTLSRLLADNDILLGQNDYALYNRDTIRSILLTTYRHGKVMIGPNQAFVTAGSLASCYTASDQLLIQLRETVEFYFRRGVLPPPAYPTRFRIAVNRQVAASLGLRLPDAAILVKQMPAGGECDDGC